MTFSRSIFSVLLVVLDFRPRPCHQCSYLPEGFLRATPTRLISAPLAKPARQWRGTCKKAERMNLNRKRWTQGCSVSTKGSITPSVIVISCLVCYCTGISISLSHTYVHTRAHATVPPPLAGEGTDFAATGSQYRKKLRLPPPQDEIYTKAALLISLSFEL